MRPRPLESFLRPIGVAYLPACSVFTLLGSLGLSQVCSHSSLATLAHKGLGTKILPLEFQASYLIRNHFFKNYFHFSLLSKRMQIYYKILRTNTPVIRKSKNHALPASWCTSSPTDTRRRMHLHGKGVVTHALLASSPSHFTTSTCP